MQHLLYIRKSVPDEVKATKINLLVARIGHRKAYDKIPQSYTSGVFSIFGIADCMSESIVFNM